MCACTGKKAVRNGRQQELTRAGASLPKEGVPRVVVMALYVLYPAAGKP